MKAKTNPLGTIRKLIAERYSDVRAIFWSGSASKGQATEGSDLDLLLIFDYVPNACKENFYYDGWPIDVSIHDLDTLRYRMYVGEPARGMQFISSSILDALEILPANPIGEEAKRMAEDAFNRGPEKPSRYDIDIDIERITDYMHDIKFSNNRPEQILVLLYLLESLINFYFRAQGKWSYCCKALMQKFQADTPFLANEVHEACEYFFRTGGTSGIEDVVNKIVSPYGRKFRSFRRDCPPEHRLAAIQCQSFAIGI